MSLVSGEHLVSLRVAPRRSQACPGRPRCAADDRPKEQGGCHGPRRGCPRNIGGLGARHAGVLLGR
jgi:hypothetical protein